MRKFEIGKSFIVLSHVSVWFFAALAGLTPFLLLFDDTPRPAPTRTYVFCAGMFVLFAGFCAASIFGLRRIRTAALAVDEQGLWKVHIGREKGLVRWNTVKSIRERQFGQRLELLGFAGEHLIDIEYQLRGFDQLRSDILAKIPKVSLLFPQRYQRGRMHFAFNVGFALLVLAGVVWSIATGKTWIAVALLLLIAIILREIATSVTAITVWRDHIDIEFPWRKLEVRSTDIQRMLFADAHNQGARVPQLALQLVNGKVIKLQGLGVDEAELYRHLSAVVPTDAKQA